MRAFAKLSEGLLRKSRLVSPRGSFDCRTGAAIGALVMAPLASYAVRGSGEDVEVAVGEQASGS